MTPPAEPPTPQEPASEPLSLEQVLRASPHIWRGRDHRHAGDAVLASGFPVLDLAFGGGWPRHALTEIRVPHWGIGELRLLLPALRSIQQDGQPLAWIEPPHLPYAPALADAGIDLHRLLLLRNLNGDADVWWAMEKLLRSTVCGLVLAWPHRPGTVAVLRRLQLAAAEGRALGMLMGPQLAGNSPATLQLSLEAGAAGLGVRVLKRRGGSASATIWLQV